MDMTQLMKKMDDAGSGNSEGYKELKDNLFKFPENSETVLRFNPSLILSSYEIWLTPSDNLPAGRDPKQSEFAFRLKNDDTHNLLAEIFGSPASWGPNAKRAVSYGMFKGGIYEFQYTEQKNAQGHAERRFKHLPIMENRDFFKSLAFKGEDYQMNEGPKAVPSLRYLIPVFVPGDEYCMSKKSWRHVQISQKTMNLLVDMQKEGYLLDNTWFKFKREGSGLQTKYTLIPCSQTSSTELNQNYNTEGLVVPDLVLATKLSTNSYCWHYLQSYIRKADQILGTNYSETMEREYKERKQAEGIGNGADGAGSGSKSSSLPSAVSEESSGSPANYETPHNMSDDDIPF